MSSSQNGWRANDRSVVSTRTVPGSTVRLAVRNGAPGDLLLHVASLFDQRVENIDGTADDWGYAERNIRGSSTTLSNHASGTAIDLNATRHPMGVKATSNFSATQISTIKSICAETNGVVVWGGEWSRPDGMHFELRAGATEEQCATALARLRGAPITGGATAPAPADSGVYRKGSKGDAVRAIQHALNKQYPAYSKLVEDGIYGDATVKVVTEFQRRAGLSADGIAGPQTQAALHI